MKNKIVSLLLASLMLLSGCSLKDSSSTPISSESTSNYDSSEKEIKPIVYSEVYLKFEFPIVAILYEGYYCWVSFTAPEDAIYRFKADSNEWEYNLYPVTYPVIEAFWQVDNDKNANGFAISEYIQLSEEAYVSFVDYPLLKGQTVYLRIRGKDYSPIFLSFNIVEFLDSSENHYHVHTGTEYVDNGDDHSLICWNNDAVLKTEEHIYGEEQQDDSGKSYHTCTLCGHREEIKQI